MPAINYLPENTITGAEADIMIYAGSEWMLCNGVWWAYKDGQWKSWTQKKSWIKRGQKRPVLFYFLKGAYGPLQYTFTHLPP